MKGFGTTAPFTCHNCLGVTFVFMPGSMYNQTEDVPVVMGKPDHAGISMLWVLYWFVLTCVFLLCVWTSTRAPRLSSTFFACQNSLRGASSATGLPTKEADTSPGRTLIAQDSAYHATTVDGKESDCLPTASIDVLPARHPSKAAQAVTAGKGTGPAAHGPPQLGTEVLLSMLKVIAMGLLGKQRLC